MSRQAKNHEYRHEPVMAAEVVAAFSSVPPGLLVDGTVGGGGHAALLLAAREDCRLLGIDRDPDAIAAAGDRLEVSVTGSASSTADSRRSPT